MNKMLKVAVVSALVGAAAMSAGTAFAADLGKKNFVVVGTWGFLDHWKEREGPFWNETLPKVSGGALTANAKSQTDLGLSGFEIMRQLKLGVYDAVHGVTGYVAQDSPAIEGADLAGVFQDFETYKKGLYLYKPILEREFEDKYNSKLLMLYAWPSQQFWCNLGDKSITDVSLATLKDKKIRTYSTTLGDFIEGVGGSAITIAFAEVVPALQKGVADCGITGTLPAYNAKWWQVVTHNVRVRLGYTSSFLAMNLKSWNSLTPDAQKLLMDELAKVEEQMWIATKKNDQRGMDCNASGPCDLGDPGGMVPVEISDADKETMKSIVKDFVVARWAKRCGTKKCVDEWNDTLGELAGLKASL